MLRVMIAFGMVVSVAGAAAAQPLPWRTGDSVAAGWTFTPGISVGAAWDSGVQTGNHPVIEALFQKYVGRVNPYAEIDFVGRRTVLNAGYSGGLDKYRGSSSGFEQHTRISVSRVVTPRFSASANASYSAANTSDRLRLTDAEVPVLDATLPFVAIDTAYVTAGSGFQYRASPRTTVSGTYRYQQMTLDRDETRGAIEVLQGGRSHAPSLQVARAFTPRLSIGGAVEYRLEFVESFAEFDIQTAAAAFSYRVNSTTTITGGGGASRLQVIATAASTIAPTFSAGFSQARRQLRIGGSYTRGFHQLYGFGSLATSDTFSAGVSAPLLDRMYYLSAQVAHSRSRAVENVGLGFDLNTTWTNASVGRRLTEWLNAEAYLTIALQGSTVRGDSNRTRLGVQFATSKPMRME